MFANLDAHTVTGILMAVFTVVTTIIVIVFALIERAKREVDDR